MKSLVLISTALCLILSGNNVLAKKDRVTVCHNGKDKEVNENALQAHLGHGDTLGTCAGIVQIQGGQLQSGQQTVTRQTVVTSSSGTTGGATATQMQQPLSLQQILDQLAQQSNLSVSQTAMPWQPVQGQAVYQYRYYPQASMYYDEGRGIYFYQQNGQWQQTKNLPSSMQTLVNTHIPLQMNTNTPYTFHPQVSQTYTTGSIGLGGQNMSQQVTTVKRTVTQTSSGIGQNQMPTTGVVVNAQQGSSQQVLTNQQVMQTNRGSGQTQLQMGQPAVGMIQTTTATQANQSDAAPVNMGGGLQLLATLQALQSLLQQPSANSAQVMGTAGAVNPQLQQNQSTTSTLTKITGTTAQPQLQQDQLKYMLQTLQTIQQNPNAQAGMNAAQQQTLQNTLQQVIQSLQQRTGLPVTGAKQGGAAVQTTTVTTTETINTTGGASENVIYTCPKGHKGKKDGVCVEKKKKLKKDKSQYKGKYKGHKKHGHKNGKGKK